MRRPALSRSGTLASTVKIETVGETGPEVVMVLDPNRASDGLRMASDALTKLGAAFAGAGDSVAQAFDGFAKLGAAARELDGDGVRNCPGCYDTAELSPYRVVELGTRNDMTIRTQRVRCRRCGREEWLDVAADSPALAAIERTRRRRPSRAGGKPEPRPSSRVAKQATEVAPGERSFAWDDEEGS